MHRGFVAAAGACCRLTGDLLLMFAGPPLGEVSANGLNESVMAGGGGMFSNSNGMPCRTLRCLKNCGKIAARLTYANGELKDLIFNQS